MGTHVFCSDLVICRISLAKSRQLQKIGGRENKSYLSEEGTCCSLTVVKYTLPLPGTFLLAGVVSHVYFKGWRYCSFCHISFPLKVSKFLEQFEERRKLLLNISMIQYISNIFKVCILRSAWLCLLQNC